MRSDAVYGFGLSADIAVNFIKDVTEAVIGVPGTVDVAGDLDVSGDDQGVRRGRRRLR